MAIERFRGDDYFLSNMYPLTNWIMADCGVNVPTSEHDYQAAKFMEIDDQLTVALSLDPEKGQHGLASKNIAHELIDAGAPVRPDWQTYKFGKMLTSLHKKFSANPDIAGLLIATGNEELVEGNNWGDRIWGVDPIGSRNGENWLGRLLMELRDDLRLGMVS